jgi:hypothetical protein
MRLPGHSMLLSTILPILPHHVLQTHVVEMITDTTAH